MNGLMTENMKMNNKNIRCMTEDTLNGSMAESIRESRKTLKQHGFSITSMQNSKSRFLYGSNGLFIGLSSFISPLFHRSFDPLLHQRFHILVQSYDRELYKDVLYDIESNNDFPNLYPSIKPRIGFNTKYLFIILND